VVDGGQLGHVHADLGDQDLGGRGADAGDRAQQVDLTTKGFQGALNLPIELVDRLLEMVDHRQVLTEKEPMMGRDAAPQGLLQLLARALKTVAPERCQAPGIVLALHHRRQDAASAGPQHVSDDR